MADSTTVALKQASTTTTSNRKLKDGFSESNLELEEDDDFEEEVDFQRTPTILKKVSTIMITSTLRWFEDDYIKGDLLGEPGAFGMAFSCRKRDAGDNAIVYAVKQINKARFYHIEKSARLEILQNMKNEIEVMTYLDHENIVRLQDVYEDRNYIYLVMDCLSGGELFERISNSDGLTEKDAAAITKQILEALDYMQQNNICHLDLKPDNIMFESNAKDAKIKLIDFGMAQIIPRLKKMKQVVGTPYYTAPEVLRGKYDRAADIWSVGVIVFCMLFGYPPFYVDADEILVGKKEEEEIFKLIQNGFTAEIKEGFGAFFPAELSDNISTEAMNFISGTLKSAIADRLTVSECLAHPWIRGKAVDKRLPKTVFDSLINFQGTCRFKMLISKLFAEKVDPSQYASTLEVFRKWDKNNDGEINLDEFRKGMKETTHLSDEEINAIFKNLDADDSRTITFDELVVSSAFNALISVDERMFSMFSDLDKNGDGSITIEELKSVIKKHKNYNKQDDIDAIIEEIDINGDGEIDYEEFLHALHPQYNETMLVKNNTIKERGFGSFDETEFAKFQDFLTKTDSKQVLEYHWNPVKLQTNYKQYKKKDTKLSIVDEDHDEHRYAKVDNLADSPRDHEKIVEESTKIATEKAKKQDALRESENMDKYDKPPSMCTACKCVLL